MQYVVIVALICFQTMAYLSEMLKNVHVDVDERRFSTARGIDGLIQPFVRFTHNNIIITTVYSLL